MSPGLAKQGVVSKEGTAPEKIGQREVQLALGSAEHTSMHARRAQELMPTAGACVRVSADTRGRVERVDSGVDALLGDASRQHGGGVQVGEGSRRRRVGQVVGGHVDGLDRRDRALLGGGDALLRATRGCGR
eukprot:2131227-Pleurochrysis_carterae.AAC.2